MNDKPRRQDQMKGKHSLCFRLCLKNHLCCHCICNIRGRSQRPLIQHQRELFDQMDDALHDCLGAVVTYGLRCQLVSLCPAWRSRLGPWLKALWLHTAPLSQQ